LRVAAGVGAISMTEIETASFIDSSTHRVSSIAYSPARFVVCLHPSQDETFEVRVAFTQVSNMRVDTSHNDGELDFPWDIIGFDSKPLAGGRWAFVLHTDMVEFLFQASWPSIERQ
jgi:hypothetical protein